MSNLLAPPASSWHEHEADQLPTEPYATRMGEPFRFEPLDLPRLRCAIDSLEDAANHTAGELHATARRDATDAIVSLLASLGVNSRAQDAVKAMIATVEHRGVSEWDLARERGEIVDDLDSPLSHHRDAREERECPA